MATLSSRLLNRESGREGDQQQLLQLFWNRAELKKEFDKIRAQSRDLGEQVKKQEALTLRVQQRLEQLEAQLGSPDTAARAVTYYHLRAVWDRCHGELESYARDLVRVHREREQREHIAGFRSNLAESLLVIQRESKEVSRSAEVLAAEIRRLREQRARRRGFWNWLERRRLSAAINLCREQRRAVTMRLGELAAELNARAAEPPPPLPGLSVAARRYINLVLIACAQELYLRFEVNHIAAQSREAAARTLADVNYGDRRDRRLLRRQIEEGLQALDADGGLRARSQTRARFLRNQLQYRSENDTVPSADSLGEIELLQSDGRSAGKKAVNILTEEYWELFSVMLS